MRIAVIAVALASSIILPASARVGSAGPNPLVSNPNTIQRNSSERRIWVPRDAVVQRYVVALRKLRVSALAAQRTEGGNLSQASRVAFQQRLDDINQFYNRRLRDLN